MLWKNRYPTPVGKAGCPGVWSASAALFGLLGTGACRESPGTCSGQAGTLCVQVGEGNLTQAPNVLSFSLHSEDGKTITPDPQLTAGVAAAFQLRHRYVVDVDLADVATSQRIDVSVRAQLNRQPVGSAAGFWLRGSDPVLNLDLVATGLPDGGADLASCAEFALRCNGNVLETCSAGSWIAQQQCPHYCQDGGCVSPPSCLGTAASCGLSQSSSCCEALPVPGGTYYRSYNAIDYSDKSFPATVSPFLLDRYEVTVGRFRQFVGTYPANKPTAGAGKNPHNPADLGWDAAWSALLPTDPAALVTQLGCTGGTYTASPSVNEQLPISCVNWYTALAFCIWDRGRLPTEAEWNFAAAGGDQQRYYPFSSPPYSTTLNTSLAVYNASGPQTVGSKSPAGDGRWGQSDLAGNLSEWILDYYRDPYGLGNCVDCADASPTAQRALRGGSFVNAQPAFLMTAFRNDATPATAASAIGFRCAR